MDLIRRDFNCKRGKGLLQCCKGAIAVERIVTMGPEVSLRVTQKGFYKRSRCSVAKLCTTLGDPMNCSTPGSCVHEIFQGYWSRLPFPSPEDHSDPGIEPMSPASLAL